MVSSTLFASFAVLARDFVSNNVSTACSYALTRTISSVTSACGGDEFNNALGNNDLSTLNGTAATLHSLVDIDSYFTNACSSNCTSTLATANASLVTVCGTTPLFNSSYTDSTFMSNFTDTLDAASFVATLYIVQGLSCTKNDGEYCLTTQASYISTSGYPTDYNALLCDYCSVEDLEVVDTYVPTASSDYQALVDPYIEAVRSVVSACPTSSLKKESAALPTAPLRAIPLAMFVVAGTLAAFLAV